MKQKPLYHPSSKDGETEAQDGDQTHSLSWQARGPAMLRPRDFQYGSISWTSAFFVCWLVVMGP